MVSAVSLRNLSKVFASPRNPGEKCVAVDGVTLDVNEGELLTMVGPRGCGKSTILRMIAGLEEPTGGETYLDGKRIDGVALRSRNVGLIFQGYALFRHITVADNIGFGLKIKKMSKKDRRRRVEELVALMGLEGLEHRKPDQLSSGQRQRVALARALAPQPRILLLDEPFGVLDAKARQRLGTDTKRWQRTLRIPTILVPHDQQEALELGDRVAILNEGRFEQVATSQNIYNHPANQFVAHFIGKVNVLSAKLKDSFSELLQNTGFEVLAGPKDFSVLTRDGHQPPEEEKVWGAMKSRAFLGRTVLLEMELRNGRPPSLVLPKQRASVNDLNPGSPVVVPIGSFQVFPSGSSVLRGSNGSHADSGLAGSG